MVSLDIPEILIILFVCAAIALAIHQHQYAKHHH